MAETGSSSHTIHDYNERYIDRVEYMIGDAILANQNARDKEPRTWEVLFYNMVQATQQPYMMTVLHTVNYLLLFGY